MIDSEVVLFDHLNACQAVGSKQIAESLKYMLSFSG